MGAGIAGLEKRVESLERTQREFREMGTGIVGLEKRVESLERM